MYMTCVEIKFIIIIIILLLNHVCDVTAAYTTEKSVL